MLQDMPEELRDLVEGGYEACLARLQGALASAQASKRAANPLSKQLEGAEAHKARMAKKVTDAKAVLAAREKEQQELLTQVEAQRKAVAEAEAALAKATAEVAELAVKYASERSAPTGAGGPPAAAGQPATAPPPGYMSIAFAEEKWVEREAAYTHQLEQLQALVATQPDGAEAAVEAGGTELGQ